MLAAVGDWCRYILDDIRNRNREEGWEPGQMTAMMTGQKGTRTEIELAHERREFWRMLADEGKTGE